MFDDDDDGVDPQIEDVNRYYFEDGEEKPVCFSILPFQFGEDDSEAVFLRKDVFLCGFVDKNLPVYKEVVAWKIRLDSEHPNIYVLSIEHKWIKLLKPRKCYGDIVRSTLITVQMLHFFGRGEQRSSNHLWDHLDEVFGKYNPKPVEDDLMKHHTLIKLFVEKDQTLMKSKILQRLIENGFKRTKKALGMEAQSIVSDGWRARKNDDNNYGNKDDSGDDCDGDGSSDDGDGSSDDDVTDQICALCDDGGHLLSCDGPCKRSFHPTKKDGRESKCESLHYTSAEVKRIGTYLCANCKNKQHQCFRCGELEPSHGPNAKVFQCNQASCGYFYHPKCIAQLLDPNATDGELERRIMSGMSFPCPIHWCFKCGHMENKAQRALQLAVCRRCPRAYHRECLPRDLSFGTKDKDGNQRAWKLSDTIFIYCLDHEIDKDTGTTSRNHIKFPATPEYTKTKGLGNSKGRMTGKRRKNKRRKNTDQSTKPTDLPNRLCGAESEQADNVGAKSTLPQIVVEPHCAAKHLKGDPQIAKQGVAARQNGAETMKGHENQFGISFCVASTETEKRVTCLAQRGTCLGTQYDGPSTKGMYDCSVQDTPMDDDVELDNVACIIAVDKYVNGRGKTQEDYTRKEAAQRKDSSENQGQNDALELDNLRMEMQADERPLEPGNKRDRKWQKNVYGLGSASGQKETLSRRENPRSDRGMVHSNDSKTIYYRKGGTEVDNVDDHPLEKQDHQDTSSDGSKKRSRPVDNASGGNRPYLDENKKRNLREDGRYAHYEDWRSERNTAADTSGYKAQSEEKPVWTNTRTGSREHSLDRQRIECGDSYRGTYNNRQRHEWLHPHASGNSSRIGWDDRRQWSSSRSPFPSAEFGGDRSCSRAHPRGSKYRTGGRHDHPQYLGLGTPQHGTSRPHHTMGWDRDTFHDHQHGRRPPHHTMGWDRAPFRDHQHGEYDDSRYGEYDATDNGPDSAHRPYTAAGVAGRSAPSYQLAGGYGEGSRAWRPVTDKYAPWPLP
ncbi:uncharacterized protein [Zea mays]|uniref:Protein ENHANCED DOWNY MILDEW 2 n=4 Tax=Zea mays TaxID=4577 RepID=A0A1D6F9I4_MAIZE|nr:uncharacterized protein LOC103648264 [Zea mays]ONM27795.1 Protein ENHANCED DOWNY MILDEW 2 [Zea mays]ONM27797.1 Protein ENHANCED DOWNY MILDEW 2 [Zea mays]ONM27805.1 Protein ENHANCED DOWNY MILDEW 2 [Zea mays]|eukprot:XP_008670975.1 uncharacterized protein LOC103648264 [Zea mays]